MTQINLEKSSTPEIPPEQTTEQTTEQTASSAHQTLTSRNWELELLISGAVFFSLFQLPGLIQRSIEDTILQTTGNIITTVLLYAKALSYLLIFNLGGHFLLRGYWVGLLGLASVFPQEIIWEKLPYPALFQDVYKTKIRSLTETAKSVDDICRMIFGFTFLLLLLMLGSGFLYAVTTPIIFALELLFPQVNTVIWTVAMFCVVFIPIFLVSTMNSLLIRKPHLDSPRLRRWLSPMISYSLFLMLGQLYNSIMFTLRSNVARGKIYGIIYFFMGCVMLAPLGDLLLGYNRHIFFSQNESALSMEAAYYENFRQQQDNEIDRTLLRFPSIQADVISDAYIRLFLPYRSNDNDSLKARIGAGFRGFHKEGLYLPKSVEETDSTRQIALAALASIYTISLNDSLYSSQEFFFHKHPQTSAPGLLTYIPTRGLHPGKNLLVVRKFGKTVEYFIPFYYAPR
ncbi:MAG: hypothetical protein EAZ92_00975 [Candidatus Kapaibacterium sp.]|nr:MAG: hypothetical protein EAZ92_00975 [Candidatus Kapabacteria bacterium]